MRFTMTISREVQDTVSREVTVDIDADDLIRRDSLADLLEAAIQSGDFDTISEDVDTGNGSEWELDLSTVEEG